MTVVATDRLDLVRLFLRVAETGQVSQVRRRQGSAAPTAARRVCDGGAQAGVADAMRACVPAGRADRPASMRSG